MSTRNLLSARDSSETELEDDDPTLEQATFGKYDRSRNPVMRWISRFFHALLSTFSRGSPVLRRHPRSLPRLNTGYGKSRFHYLKKLLYVLFLTVLLFLVLSLLNGILRPSYMNPPAHYRELERKIRGSAAKGRGNPNRERIFIASNIINEELIKGSWGANLLEVIDILGPDNVFVSIYENDSGQGTRDALFALRDKLPCNSSIVAGDHVSLSDFPKMPLPDGSLRTKRLVYLAEIRNRLLLPLEPESVTADWKKKHPSFRSAPGSFDKVLFLNDIIFNPASAAQLLFSTNQDPETGRSEYTAACALDFVGKTLMYDSFVVRDTDGYGTGFFFYPWFVSSGSGESRKAVLAEKDAVPVRSCWGGMAAFDASTFIPKVAVQLERKKLDLNSNVTLPAIRFRSTPEPFWEAAECCLIYADIEVRNALLTTLDPASQSAVAGHDRHVYVNPYIRVAYEERTWAWLPTAQRYERFWQFLQPILSGLFRKPEFNPRRDHAPGALVEDRVWIPAEPDKGGVRRGGRFETVSRVAEPGAWCGQRKMFVMKEDLNRANRKGDHKNWESIRIPRGV